MRQKILLTMFWETMISSLLIITTVISYILFPPPTVSIGNNNDWNSEDISQEEEIEVKPVNFAIDDEQYEEYKKKTSPDIQNLSLDLDGNSTEEKVVIKSYSGFPGDQNTEIYIGLNSNPDLVEDGSFYALNVHKIDNAGNHITELQLQAGQSINTLFYKYNNGKLKRIIVSTEKPSSWHGIISRNIPEFKDIDKNGDLELLAYYNFLHDFTRTVEVYKYADGSFNLIQKYEEVLTSS